MKVCVPDAGETGWKRLLFFFFQWSLGNFQSYIPNFATDKQNKLWGSQQGKW